ncbi:hypothetical protein EVAR_65706_1 [Eumeta japonica]|uniref:Uncharacterized protein n=1 Tax=Eumeta variegata TaxID=151549 RepID=A0A4C2A6S5_EUMVA|nr:hypothetical protein EVAR_65706_1 [Eumeta japonica]
MVETETAEHCTRGDWSPNRSPLQPHIQTGLYYACIAATPREPDGTRGFRHVCGSDPRLDPFPQSRPFARLAFMQGFCGNVRKVYLNEGAKSNDLTPSNSIDQPLAVLFMLRLRTTSPF